MDSGIIIWDSGIISLEPGIRHTCYLLWRLTGVLNRDLRRTAVVRLARAGCTIPELAAITGHTLASVHRILESYLPPDKVVATNAIKKLQRHISRAPASERSGKS